ncbi:MAG: CdaR family protein [Proteobacteria bacterium]|nr:CdaR family protein [Pseudomonadota bacterium]
MRRHNHIFSFIKRFVQDLYTKNITLKITALVTTLALWFMVTTSYKIEVVKKLPLNFITAPDLVISADVIKDVEVRFTGPRAFIQEIMQKNYLINIDLRDRKIGFVSYRLYPELLRLPLGVKITGFYPSEIATRLEKLKTKTVKVIPSLIGEVPYGYKVKNINIEPKTVEITGPESIVTKSEEVYTAVIDLSNVSEPMTRNIAIDAKYREKFKDVSAENFSILIDVVPYITSKTFTDINIKVIGSKSYNIAKNKINVTIQGPTIIMDKLSAQDIKAVIDLSFNAPGTYDEPIVVKLPDGLRLVSIVPKKVKVSIKGE